MSGKRTPEQEAAAKTRNEIAELQNKIEAQNKQIKDLEKALTVSDDVCHKFKSEIAVLKVDLADAKKADAHTELRLKTCGEQCESLKKRLADTEKALEAHSDTELTRENQIQADMLAAKDRLIELLRETVSKHRSIHYAVHNNMNLAKKLSSIHTDKMTDSEKDTIQDAIDMCVGNADFAAGAGINMNEPGKHDA